MVWLVLFCCFIYIWVALRACVCVRASVCVHVCVCVRVYHGPAWYTWRLEDSVRCSGTEVYCKPTCGLKSNTVLCKSNKNKYPQPLSPLQPTLLFRRICVADLNSGPHICAADTLPTSHASSTLIVFTVTMYMICDFFLLRYSESII